MSARPAAAPTRVSSAHQHEPPEPRDRADSLFDEPFDGDTAWERDRLWHGDDRWYWDVEKS